MTADVRRPRLVLVTRKTPLELLLERHGTVSQAKFYLASRGQAIDPYRQAHERFECALSLVLQAIPADQRRTRVDRNDLDRFLFADDDIIMIVGQDGLVPNVAKYLRGQITIGVNPDPERYDGVLCRHRPAQMPELLDWLQSRPEARYRIQQRVMAHAQREDGQTLLALNEIFIGHSTHQSAKYRLRVDRKEERHSSSGLICATGTGSTGWAASIARQRQLLKNLPQPETRHLAWFVREPFPSVYTGVELDFGVVNSTSRIEVVSEMGEGGVMFADGIETDRVEFLDGQSVSITVAQQTLNLVVPVKQPETQMAASPDRSRRTRKRDVMKQS